MSSISASSQLPRRYLNNSGLRQRFNGILSHMAFARKTPRNSNISTQFGIFSLSSLMKYEIQSVSHLLKSSNLKYLHLSGFKISKQITVNHSFDIPPASDELSLFSPVKVTLSSILLLNFGNQSNESVKAVSLPTSSLFDP